MKFAIRDHRNFPRRWDAEPVVVEQTHEFTHAGDPHVSVNQVRACHENILPTLHRRYRLAQWLPDRGRDCSSITQFIEGMYTTKAVVGRSELFDGIGDGIWLGALQCVEVGEYNCFGILSVGHCLVLACSELHH